MFQPTTEQEVAITRIVSEPTRAALAACGTGFGKTLVAVEVTRHIAKQALVIAPLNTFDGWTATYQRQLGLTPRQINSKPAGLAAAADLFAGEPGVYLIGREFFHLSGVTLPRRHKGVACQDKKNCTDPAHMTTPRAARWSWAKAKNLDLVILDESHAAANRNSNMATALRQIPKNAFKLAMSATPARNKFGGLWNPCRWLWPNATNEAGELYVDTAEWRWAAKWAHIEYDEYAGRRIGPERNPGAFVASLPCYVYYEAPKVTVVKRRVRIELSPRQREVYDQMRDDAVAWLGEHPLVADIPIVQKARMRQIALAEPVILEDGSVDFDPDGQSAKADSCALIDSKHHPSESILFFTSSQKFAALLARRLPNAAEWSGKVSKLRREEIKADFMAGEIKNLVAVIPAIAEGVDGLQTVCHVEVWLDKSLDGVLNEQAEGRINRQGQEQDIISYELVAKETDDERYLNKLVAQAIEMRETLKGR